MITSTSSSQVKNVLSLQKKAKVRRQTGQFVVEGAKMVLEAPGDRLVKVYVSESFERDNDAYLKELGAFDRLETVSDNVFLRMSDTQTPQGIMAVVQMKEISLPEMLKENPLLLLIENLQDPGNLGTIVRTGEGAGVTGIIMSAGTVDMYNPKTIRSTMGSIYRVPFVSVQDFADAIRQCKSAGIKLYAAHLGGSCAYTQADYTGASGFLIGNESNGLTEQAADSADMLIKIPMKGRVESLNAATAAAILAFEAARQRG